jgi:hypothetical protein
MSFNTWMSKVDRKVSATAGLSVHDLSDQPFYEWWEEGMTPSEAASITLEDNGFN